MLKYLYFFRCPGGQLVIFVLAVTIRLKDLPSNAIINSRENFASGPNRDQAGARSFRLDLNSLPPCLPVTSYHYFSPSGHNKGYDMTGKG